MAKGQTMLMKRHFNPETNNQELHCCCGWKCVGAEKHDYQLLLSHIQICKEHDKFRSINSAK